MQESLPTFLAFTALAAASQASPSGPNMFQQHGDSWLYSVGALVPVCKFFAF